MRRRWGDADDDEDVLPEPTTVGPNDKGIITKTEYYKNAKGVAMKKITKVQLVKVQTKVYDVSTPFSRCTASYASIVGSIGVKSLCVLVTLRTVAEYPSLTSCTVQITSERKEWPKFGLAATQGNKGVTVQSVDQVSFERTNLPKKEEKKDPNAAAKHAMVCTCPAITCVAALAPQQRSPNHHSRCSFHHHCCCTNPH